MGRAIAIANSRGVVIAYNACRGWVSPVQPNLQAIAVIQFYR
ncbi:MAG: hypothetical protein QNJ41_21260 [Xenococcaceae cyanobacterium MO_188.B32]|nr:hypothetical protein [Xenococcaceae cyanobacterium MO_188.B32]